MVSLYADGQKRVFASDAATVGDVLKHSGLVLGAGDLVEPSVSTPLPQSFFNINVYRARPVLVVDGDKTYRISSAYQSPRLLAESAGLKLYPEDQFSAEVISDIVTPAAVGVKVVVDRAIPMVVNVDGKDKSIRTQSQTVGDALSGAGIALGPKDTISALVTTPVAAGLHIKVVRQDETDVTVTEPLPRSVQIINDPNLPKGQKKIRTEGSDGQRVATYRLSYRDGVEVKRQLVRLISQVNPVTHVEVVGTKEFFAGSVEYWRPMVETAAAEWNFDPNTMLRIMSCESHGNATVVSRFVVGGEHPTGLFQYLPSSWRAAGGRDDNILDGAAQIKLTARKMALYGTSPWQCR